MNATAQHLIKHNIKPSAQRIAIMKYLLEHHNHPSVDRIYNELLPEMPTLSRTTVYNTLKLLDENGALITLNIDNKTMRFDGNIMPHAHFMCIECGKIYDIPFPSDIKELDTSLKEFKVEEVKLYYKGICKECQGK